MILHDIAIRGFRCFAEELHVGPFNKRVTIVHAPNGTGKTTLLDALYHGLLERHEVTGDKALERIESTGRSLQAAVNVTFESAGVRYRISKRFLKDTGTVLEREEHGVLRPFKDGRDAQDFMRQLLFASPGTKGAMDRSRHFGLGTILWAPQGTTAYGALPADLAARVNQQLQGEASAGAPSDARVADRVAAWYRNFWTANGRECAGTGSADVPGLRKEFDAAQGDFARAQAALEAVETLRIEYEDACAFEAQEQRRARDLAQRSIELRELAGKHAIVKTSVVEAQRRVADMQQRWSVLHRTVEALTITREQIAQTSTQIADRQNVEADLVERIATATQTLTEHQRVLQQLTEQSDSITQDEERSRNAVRFLDLTNQITNLTLIFDKCEALRLEVDALRTSRHAILAPDKRTFKKIRNERDTVRDLRTQLDAAVIHVEIELQQPFAMTLETGVPANQCADGGTTLRASGAPLVEIDIAGVGRIRARGPSESAAAIRTKLDAAQASLTDVSRAFGTSDVEELESRREQAELLDGTIGRLEATLKAMLPDGGTTELLSRRSQTAAELDALSVTEPSWRTTPPAAVALFTAARERRDVYRRQLALTRAQYDVSVEAKGVLDAALRNAQIEIAQLKENRAGSIGKVEQLSLDGQSDETRLALLDQSALEWDAAKAVLGQAEASLATFVGDPAAELTAIDNLRENVDEELTRVRGVAVRAKTRLDSAVANGSYDEFARCDERMRLAREKLDCTERLAKAARILQEAIEAVRAEQRALVLAPVQFRASSLYARIAGTRHADIRFDSRTFVPSGIAFDGSNVIKVGTTLSGGEDEQLHMVARLALADELATGERRLVVLDDSLAVTDSARFARFLSIVDEFSRDRIQFLIMTWDKTRYAALTDATTIDLRALRQGIKLATAS